MKHILFKKIIFIILGFFLFNIVITYILHFSIMAATCMTVQQVQADARCLYILQNQIYEKASRATPHHGHPCGTDVTSIIPAFHQNDPALYLLPNYVANVCAAPTPTPTLIPTISAAPIITPIPLLTNTPVPVFSQTPLPTPTLYCLGSCCGSTCLTITIPQPTTMTANVNTITNNPNDLSNFLLALLQLLLNIFLAGLGSIHL